MKCTNIIRCKIEREAVWLAIWLRDELKRLILQKRVRREVEEGLMQKQGALASIGILLSGGDLPQAAALAASSGHMRLAITIMQVSNLESGSRNDLIHLI